MKIEGKGLKIEKKENQHQDKKIRVAPYLDTEHHGKLKRLAIACDVTPATLALDLINYCLDHPGFISYIQEKYKVPKDSIYRVVPVTEGNKIIY
jgi:hypothetical protein